MFINNKKLDELEARIKRLENETEIYEYSHYRTFWVEQERIPVKDIINMILSKLNLRIIKHKGYDYVALEEKPKLDDIYKSE